MASLRALNLYFQFCFFHLSILLSKQRELRPRGVGGVLLRGSWAWQAAMFQALRATNSSHPFRSTDVIVYHYTVGVSVIVVVHKRQ